MNGPNGPKVLQVPQVNRGWLQIGLVVDCPLLQIMLHHEVPLAISSVHFLCINTLAGVETNATIPVSQVALWPQLNKSTVYRSDQQPHTALEYVCERFYAGYFWQYTPIHTGEISLPPRIWAGNICNNGKLDRSFTKVFSSGLPYKYHTNK